MTTYYAVLGCETNASYEELKRKYQELALQVHPDKLDAPSSTTAFSTIDEAWKVLRDPEQRRMYDATLEQKRLNDQPILHDTVPTCELNRDEVNSLYSYNCRCGGLYLLTEEQISSDCFVTCDQCTLMIHVKVCKCLLQVKRRIS